AYHDVTKAMEERDRLVNLAQAEALRKKRAAHASALQVVRQAEASAHERIVQTEAAQVSFLARHQIRMRLSLAEEGRLLWQAFLALYRGQAPAVVLHAYERQRQERIAAQIVLTDFRLFWDALAQALGGREKV